jgi:hypothetical protein
VVSFAAVVINTGSRVALREQMQTAADAGALSGATVHARGMNLIAAASLASSEGVPSWHMAFSTQGATREQNDSVVAFGKRGPRCPISAIENDARPRSPAPSGP